MHMYTSEKFSAAVRELAVHTGTIQERLRDAYVHNISHLDADRVGSSLQEKFAQVRTRMTWAEGPDGTVEATTRIMSVDEAQRLIGLICDIQAELERLYWTDAHRVSLP